MATSLAIYNSNKALMPRKVKKALLTNILDSN
ncbi:hypothetical protein BH09BAC1_BH09BAC1_23600 [soil metagenome]